MAYDYEKQIEAQEKQLQQLKEIKQRLKDHVALNVEQQNLYNTMGASVEGLSDGLDRGRAYAEATRDFHRENNTALREDLQLTQEKLRQYEALSGFLKYQKEVRQTKLEVAEKELELAQKEYAQGRLTVEQLEEKKRLVSEINNEIGRSDRVQEKFTSSISAGKAKMEGILGNIIQVGVEAFNAEKAFERAFQMPEAFTQQLSALHDELAITGVSMGDLTQSTGDLITNVTDFTMASGPQQKALQQTTAQLNELGVASADVAQGVQASMKFFGQSIQGAERTARELFSVARELQVVPGEMAAQYAAMGPQLAKFGNEGIRTFKELSRIQKLTGMEMSKVIQITSQFDTFEGAAEATGKLNAALGGNFVNAMDMMMDTDPASRFDNIRSAIEDAGLSFDTMSYYQKQFYTDALGLSDVGDLALMLSGRTDLMTGATETSAASQVELAERAQATMNIQEQFQAIIAANSDSIIGLMHGIQGLIKPLMTLMKHTEKIIPLFVGLKTITFLLGLTNLWFGSTQAMVEATGKKSIFIIGGIALAMGLLAVAMMIASPSLLVLELVAFAFAIRLMGNVLSKASPALVTAGGAMSVFGAGLFTVLGPIALVVASIAALAFGVGYMAESFGSMFNALDAEKIGLIGTFFLSVGAGALGMALAAVGLIAFAIGMGALAFSLKFIATEDLQAIATIMESMAATDMSGFGEAAAGIRGIAKALDDVDPFTLMELGRSAKSFEIMSTALNGLASENAGGVATALGDVSTAINDLPAVKTVLVTAAFASMALASAAMAPVAMAFAAGAGATTVAADRFSSREGTPTTAASGGGGPKEITVRLELDGKVLAKEVVNIQGRQIQGVG